MKNLTVKQFEEKTGHVHSFFFYDNHTDTFDTIRYKKEPRDHLLIGTVWECQCGAREIRFIVWNGEHD